MVILLWLMSAKLNLQTCFQLKFPLTHYLGNGNAKLLTQIFSEAMHFFTYHKYKQNTTETTNKAELYWHSLIH